MAGRRTIERTIYTVRCSLCFGEAERYANALACNLMVETHRGREVCSGPIQVVAESRTEEHTRAESALRLKAHDSPRFLARDSHRSFPKASY